MDWEYSYVVRFDLGPLLQGQTRIAKLKSAYNLFIIGPSCLFFFGQTFFTDKLWLIFSFRNVNLFIGNMLKTYMST